MTGPTSQADHFAVCTAEFEHKTCSFGWPFSPVEPICSLEFGCIEVQKRASTQAKLSTALLSMNDSSRGFEFFKRKAVQLRLLCQNEDI